jgi:hypothetical protein
MELVFALLPILLFAGFFMFAKQKAQQAGNPLVEKLEEIRVELERLRRAVDKDGFGFSK